MMTIKFVFIGKCVQFEFVWWIQCMLDIAFSVVISKVLSISSLHVWLRCVYLALAFYTKKKKHHNQNQSIKHNTKRGLNYRVWNGFIWILLALCIHKSKRLLYGFYRIRHWMLALVFANGILGSPICSIVQHSVQNHYIWHRTIKKNTE